VCNRTHGILYRTLISPNEAEFVRGDHDRDGEVTLSDAVGIAAYLFQDAPPPVCADASDADDSGQLDIVDPLYLLFALFIADSLPPPAPFPDPGKDPTFRDNLACNE